ncbi:MAG: hypothetical protein HOL38_12260 [Verrucomicrobia bacterium]|nr:hypothetical protein [Verrucomicrobiota bacterium]
MAILIIARGTSKANHAAQFEVPFSEGASILDGLMWIRENVDPTLAFRFSCINANVCKECVMRIDGKNRYACVERLKPGPTEIAPLASKALIRDLVCDTVPPAERL